MKKRGSPLHAETYADEEVILARLREAFARAGLFPGRVAGDGYHGKGRFHLWFPGPVDVEP